MPDTIDETIAALLEAGADEKEIPALLKEKFGDTAPKPKPEQGSGGATAVISAARAVPAIVQGGARFAAGHPAAAQKMINAGVTGVAATTGGILGGTPGAIAGGAIRGVAPSQAAIRETAGRMIGETPAVAKGAGRAMGVVHFAKETAGLKIDPTGLTSTGNPARAVDNFADSMGQKVVRILDPYGKVVVGPEAAAATKPSLVSRALTGASYGGDILSKILSHISGPIAMGDLAQAAEPTRRDIGFLGLGKSLKPEEIQALEEAAFRKRMAQGHDINLR